MALIEDYKVHELTMAFIRSLEFYAPSVNSVESLRAHPIYTAFERRWQLPVYFQLRWKEIVSRLEESLSVTRIEAARTTGQHYVYIWYAKLTFRQPITHLLRCRLALSGLLSQRAGAQKYSSQSSATDSGG